MNLLKTAAVIMLVFPQVLYSQSQPDSVAIKKVVLDYIEGYYSGDAARMERAVHPDLAKRMLEPTADKKGRLTQMTAAELIQGTGSKTNEMKEKPDGVFRRDVQIFDVYGNIATVRVLSNEFMDYLHLVKINHEWKIINVLWEFRPELKERYFGIR